MNFYVKTKTTKFYVTDVDDVRCFSTVCCFYNEQKIIIGVPITEIDYYLECNPNKFEILPTDLKRGVIHL